MIARFITFSISITIFNIALCQPQLQKKVEWLQKGYYILNPDISHNGGEVAFVRQLSGKDSTVGASTFGFNVKQNLLPGNAAATRLYDPVVALLNVGNKQLSLIDFGWSPVFSPRDNRIAYSYQRQPLQKQDKLFATAFSGNSIKVYNKATGKSQEIAKPSGGFLLDPFFRDSLHVLYKVGNTVNGPYGGGIGFNEVNLNTKKITTIRQPAIRYRLYDIMGDAYIINNRLAYMVYTPADSGQGLAGEFQHLLMSGKDTLHHFGVRRFTNVAGKFTFTSNNEMLYLDDNHLLAEDTSFVVTYQQGKVASKKPLLQQFTKAYISPGGKYILYINKNLEAFVMNIDTYKQVKIPLPARDFHAIAWGANATSLAIVQDHETFAGTDVLYLFDVKE